MTLGLSLAAAALLGADLGPSAPGHALLIGVGEFASGPSDQTVQKDLEGLSKVLQTSVGIKKENIEVLSGKAATKKEITNSLKRLAERSRPNGLAFFYFTGQGFQTRDSVMLVPHEFQFATRAKALSSGLKASEVARQLSQVESSLLVVAFDAGRTVNFLPGDQGRTSGPRTAGRGDWVTPSSAGRGPKAVAQFFSVSAGQQAYASQEGGLFSQSLISGLGGAAAVNGSVTVSSLADYLVRAGAPSETAPRRQDVDARIQGPGALTFRLSRTASRSGAGKGKVEGTDLRI